MYCNFANSNKITLPEVHSVSVLLPLKDSKNQIIPFNDKKDKKIKIFSPIKFWITICKFVHCSTKFHADMLCLNVYFVCSFIIILHTRCQVVAEITTIGLIEW